MIVNISKQNIFWYAGTPQGEIKLHARSLDEAIDEIRSVNMWSQDMWVDLYNNFDDQSCLIYVERG